MSDTEYLADHVQTVDIGNGGFDLLALHALVARKNTRVELLSPLSDGPCVLISKSELQTLERAIEILAATDDVRAMRSELARLVSYAAGSDPLLDSSRWSDEPPAP